MARKDASEDDLVVLVHGFGAKGAAMWIMASRLRVAGFRVVHWNYFSWFDSIENHAQRFRSFLSTALIAERRFHIVAHSMGSIIVRAGLSGARFQNLGRIVFLAPPNGGSPVARIASMFVGSIVKPSRELSDRRTSYVNCLKGSSEIETGIIAAKFDFLVPLQKTHLQGETQHQALFATHNSLLLSGVVSKMAASFLRTGDFNVSKAKEFEKAG
jgi:pimeloyl-ACP methyl ester carboxylesterase